ncbi:MAG: YXWGXW repeat-containing protein [Dokdonella sp.]
MNTTKVAGFWTAICLGLSLAMTAPASARAVIGVTVDVAPPPARIERVIVRPGYAWAPGYWRWNGVHHVWIDGVWIAARPGRRYVPAAWVRIGPAWHFHRGLWR